MKRKILARTIAALFSLAGAAHAQTWDGGGVAGGSLLWSTGANWDTNVAPVNNGTANVTFGGVVDLAPDMDANWSISSLTFNNTAGAFVLGSTGGFTLTLGAGGITNNDSQNQTINNAATLAAAQTWNAASGGLIANGVVNNGGNTLSIGGSGNAQLGGVISGSGGLTLNGTGTTTLSGTLANTYTGTTTVNSGTLVLQKTAGVNSVLIGVVIGDGTGTDTLRLGASNQIGNTSITVNSSGVFDLAGFSESTLMLNVNGGNVTTGTGSLTIISASVNMTGGNIASTGAGALVLQVPLVTNASASTATISGALNLGAGTRTFQIADGAATDDLDVSAVISNGSITKTGAGQLVLSGSMANTVAGAVSVQTGTLVLRKTAGVNAISGINLFVGDTGAPNSDFVRLEANDQIADTTSVQVNPSGRLDLNGFNETVSNLTLLAGSVVTGTGTLTLSNQLSTTDYSAAATIAGNLNLAGGTRTFNVAQGSALNDLDISAAISNGDILKTGTGRLRLSGTNNITGGVTVSAGTLAIANNGAVDFVGLDGGAVEADGGPRTLAGGLFITLTPSMITGTNDLTFLGNSVIADGADLTNASTGITTFAGGITQAGAGFPVDLRGAGTTRIAGSLSNNITALLTVHSGTLLLAKTTPNAAFQGSLTIGDAAASLSSLVRLEAANQIPDFVAVTLTRPSTGAATLDLNGFDDTLGTLIINGAQVINVGTLTVGNVTATSAPAVGSNLIAGNVSLGGVTRTFSVAAAAPVNDLDVTGALSNGGLIKTGAGRLRIGGGTLTLVALNAGALDTTGVLTVSPGGSFTQEPATHFAGTLRSRGSFIYNGGTFSGQLLNEGSVTFNAPFTALGGFTNSSTLALGATGSLDAGGPGIVNEGTLSLAGGALQPGGAGAVVNNGEVSGFGTIGGNGGFTNNAYVAVSGGHLTLDNSGGQNNAGNIDVPAGRQLRLNDPLSNTGAIALGGGTIGSTATLTNNAAGIVSGRGTITAPLANSGTLRAEGGTLNVANAFANSGTVVVSGGAGLTGGAITNMGRLQGDGTIANAVTNAAGGAIRAEAGKALSFVGSVAANAGEVNLQGGTLDFAGPFTNSTTGFISGRGALYTGGLTNNGVMAFSGGSTDIHGDVINAAGARIVTSGAGATTTFFDDVTHNGLEIFTGAGASTVFFGAQSGAGSFTGTGTVYFIGDLRPGNSPAEVSYGGDLVFGSAASLTLEIGGLTAGAQYDRLDVAGTLFADGSLDVVLYDGFTPHFGDSFDLFDAGEIAGGFDAVTLPELAGDLEWDATQLQNTGQLRVVPEPGIGALFVSGLALLGLRRRRPSCARASQPRTRGSSSFTPDLP